MIRIVLLGRTGNHLFQYALGRVLSENHGVPLVMDASWFNSTGWSEVSHFLKLPLRANVVRPCSLASRALRNLAGKHYWEFLSCPFLRESTTDQSFDPRFLAAPADCVLFGYFQTPGYFKSIAEKLREELNDLLEDKDVQSCGPHPFAKQLNQAESVAVHIRRGDFLIHRAFQVCDESYYRKAMNQMRTRVSGARFFIFSDDPEWCRATFRDEDTLVSENRTENPLHDLLWMSRASHHIIANSTYSWWAAWLGQKPGQVVLMPDRWYASDMIAPISEKLGGDHWLTIGADY